MADDDFRTEIRWPEDPLRDPSRPPRQPAAPRIEPTEPVSRPAAPPPGTATPRPPVEPATEVLTGTVATSDAQRLGRVVLEGYDRFADRVLERLRMMREDVDTDLAAVRSELATLRQAVDDVAERVELRKLRATIDELRGDISGLRRAVLEWPGLEQVSSDVAALRADLSDMAKPPSRDLSVLAPMLEEMAALREEFVSLRRRVALRVSNEGELSEERLAAIAEAVASRLERPRIQRGR